MFLCAKCGTPSVPGQKPVKIAVETREKLYYLGGSPRRGWEIVKEQDFHGECAKVFQEEREDASFLHDLNGVVGPEVLRASVEEHVSRLDHHITQH